MEITFLGGAGGVTGSKHLIETDGAKILLDCGQFQGLPDVRSRNRFLSFAPESINAVILSHAHIDHCGMLPILVKRGYSGPIFATPATRDVAFYMMNDAAGIEVQDAEYRMKHKIGAKQDRPPLFTPADIPAVMRQFVDAPYAREFKGWQDVVPGVRLKMYDAGHILGSAAPLLEIQGGAGVQRVLFTGDLGSRGMPLIPDPEMPEESAGTVLIESTYGQRLHDPLDKAIERLEQAVIRIAERKGKILMPAFSLGRTQALVYILHKLMKEERIPRLPVYVDSPLAADVTDVFRAHSRNYDKETKLDFGADDPKPLAFKSLKYVRLHQESKLLNTEPGPFIVISASGMMSAGRVVHHLRHTVADKRNGILVTGYQAEGTTGRRLIEGAKKIELLGDWFPVKAEVVMFNEFSAHADKKELTEYVEGIKGVHHVFLVHGEPEQADKLRDEWAQAHPDWEVKRPREGDTAVI